MGVLNKKEKQNEKQNEKHAERENTEKKELGRSNPPCVVAVDSLLRWNYKNEKDLGYYSFKYQI